MSRLGSALLFTLAACASPDRWRPQYDAAGAALRAGRYDEAERRYQDALAQAEKVQPADRRLEQSLVGLADYYSVRGQPARAEPLYRRAVDAAEQAGGPGDLETARRARDLALYYHSSGRLSEAEAYYRRALLVTQRALGGASPETAARFKDLASVLEDQGRPEEAEASMMSALAIHEKLAPGGADAARDLVLLAGLAERRGDRSQARALYRRALVAAEQSLKKNDPLLTVIRLRLKAR